MGFLHQAIVVNEMLGDKRLHILDRAGARAAAVFDDPEGMQKFESLPVDPGFAQAFKGLREGMCLHMRSVRKGKCEADSVS